ncbi:hypothetical protein [Pseudomonas sp. Irchel 3E20]|uniref:hypothetical protein n=1 Tax=Pseudomonas sp. Irchel 3E20 TaxID=2008983 RepID=UPI00159561FD|nr:hypothetical protein [Pseudomonas sp. Irchel 3E20]
MEEQLALCGRARENHSLKGIKLAKFMWGVTIFMSLIGAIVGFGGMYAATSAPQEAAAAAMGLTCAVIPYCIARAFTELRSL